MLFDEMRVERLLLRGKTPDQIQEQLGLSDHQYRAHRESIEVKWGEASAAGRTEAIGFLFAAHKFIVESAFDAYEESKGTKVVTTTTSSETVGDLNNSNTDSTKTVETEEVGDPSYLRTAQNSLKAIAELTGANRNPEEGPSRGLLNATRQDLEHMLGIDPTEFAPMPPRLITPEDTESVG